VLLDLGADVEGEDLLGHAGGLGDLGREVLVGLDVVAGRRGHAADGRPGDEAQHAEQQEPDERHQRGHGDGPDADDDQRQPGEHDERDLLHEQLGALGVVAHEVLQPTLAVGGPLVPRACSDACSLRVRADQRPGLSRASTCGRDGDEDEMPSTTRPTTTRAHRHVPRGPVDGGVRLVAGDGEREAGHEEQGERLEDAGDDGEEPEGDEELAVLGPGRGLGRGEDALESHRSGSREEEDRVGFVLGREVGRIRRILRLGVGQGHLGFSQPVGRTG
jgi:hypothetical protein